MTDPAAPKRQFRAMWISSVVNIDWPTKASQTAPDRIAAQKAEYLGWLDLAERLNHNAVVVQVRPTADAFWPSPYEPWSEYLTGVRGQDPGWDPLAFLIDEAHKRNLEFHAWFNPYRVSMPDPAAPAPTSTSSRPTTRCGSTPTGWWPTRSTRPAARLYYNPGIPEVRAFVQTAMLDAVERYDVDGVHFDDYFYPYPAANQDFADDATFAAYNRGFADKADWRRDNINLLVQEFGTADQGGQAVGEVRDQPVRHLAQQDRRPARLRHRRLAVVRHHLRRHPQVGQGGVDRLHRAADLLEHRRSRWPTTPS